MNCPKCGGKKSRMKAILILVLIGCLGMFLGFDLGKRFEAKRHKIVIVSMYDAEGNLLLRANFFEEKKSLVWPDMLEPIIQCKIKRIEVK